jgi:hypothetical protein
MPAPPHELHRPAAASTIRTAEPIEPYTIAQSLKHGPRGAYAVAGISVALLFIGWLAFYFLLFLPRGSVG